MKIDIIGSSDRDRVYCTGSFTKFLTTYTCLSLLAETYPLEIVLDETEFLSRIASKPQAKNFLILFQKIIGSPFTIRDLCSYYSGLPYTFDLAEEELMEVEKGKPFKHHHILDEKEFLYRCKNHITLVYPNRSKFHYSEIAIIFLGYFIEKVYNIPMEALYQKYILNKFQLKHSLFSRMRVDQAYCQDLSDRYDYPSVAILDHGFFAYSNGFFTTLNDMQILIANLMTDDIFKIMTDLSKARAASNRLMNGLSVEIRKVDDDIIYGYEGLSYSGCNLWAYSTKYKQGYVIFHNSEEEVYKIVYEDKLGYKDFSPVPLHTQKIYENFIKNYLPQKESRVIPKQYQGTYHRVKVNEKNLSISFLLTENSMIIRNPDKVQYDVIYVNGCYRIKCKDNVHGAKVGLYTAKSGQHYFLYDGTLYKKI